ncbi:molybdenum cofactor guanylyltransferase [Sphingomonas sp. 3P27F8]|uniref:molybdenum cofactor guanylyltransferase n=1 Tax=Sphingomonas sp. 3P27F8 TaxID=2502213 RepID=UPI0010F4E794|nr:molybdenum cofactor guanylyltransferase [Sphingomonas sp. 3P27F8]
MTRILGAVLAGGLGRRFGSDKAVATFHGEQLIDRVIERLAAQVDRVIICGRTWADHISATDRPAPHLGPLGGLNAALHHAEAHGFGLVLAVPCDAPDLPADLASVLIAAGPPAFLADLPVIGCWPSALASVLDRHLATTSDRSVRLWATVAGARPVPYGAIVNINTLHDLRQAEFRND